MAFKPPTRRCARTRLTKAKNTGFPRRRPLKLQATTGPNTLSNSTFDSTRGKLYRLANHFRLAGSFPTFGSHRTAETVASPTIRIADTFGRIGIPCTFVPASHFRSGYGFESS